MIVSPERQDKAIAILFDYPEPFYCIDYGDEYSLVTRFNIFEYHSAFLARTAWTKRKNQSLLRNPTMCCNWVATNLPMCFKDPGVEDVCYNYNQQEKESS